MRLVYYLWESFYNHEDMVIHLWERFFNHEEVVWILIQYVWSDACFLRIWAVSKTNPHKLIIWSCDILAHAFIVLLSILTAVRLFQIMMVVYFLVPTSEFTLHTPGVYKGCHNDGKVKVTTSKRCSSMLSRVSTCERASWTQLPTPFEAYGQPGRFLFRPADGVTLGFTHAMDITYTDRLGTGNYFDHWTSWTQGKFCYVCYQAGEMWRGFGLWILKARLFYLLE